MSGSAFSEPHGERGGGFSQVRDRGQGSAKALGTFAPVAAQAVEMLAQTVDLVGQLLHGVAGRISHQPETVFQREMRRATERFAADLNRKLAKQDVAS